MAENKIKEDKIKTEIICQNIAPIENLTRVINSNSLKMGVFANNGSGKTFLSRLFRLTENQDKLILDSEGKSPTDKFLTFGKSFGKFSFSITDKQGDIKDKFTISITKGQIPDIPKTNYLYHTFNQDYVEQNIQTLNYDKDSNIEGFILGKVNIDLNEEESELAKIAKEGKDLSDQVEADISQYVQDKISNIQNIKRLNEYQLLETQNIFNGVKKEKFNVNKSTEELIEDYNKIKSVPENLEDIQSIETINIDLTLLNQIQENLLKEYSLSKLADDFKQKVKSKQIFVETGIQLIESDKSSCPFCEQVLNANALNLIDNYTKFLTDSEARTIRTLNDYLTTLSKNIESLKKIENNNSKRIVSFNEFKSKYIPSSESIELNFLTVDTLIQSLQLVINKIEEKLKNISQSVIIEQSLIDNIIRHQAFLNNTIDRNNEEIGNINLKKNRISEESRATRKEVCKGAYNYLIDKHQKNITYIFELREKWRVLNDSIKRKKEQQKVSKRKKVATTIKTVLNYFFSDKYTLDEETFSLVFKRNILEKNQAKDILSEGEKNIVAFAYYIGDAHLKIKSDEDYEKLFFIVDDLISSMDFSHVYTLCGVIRDINQIIDKLKRERIIIFTHNNDFMRVLTSNNIVDKKLLLKKGELKDFNNNLTVPYINHLMDIYSIARKGEMVNHTTANSIRHIIETLTKFQNIEVSIESIANYIKVNIPNDTKSYTLINDLSHGGWRSEQLPINDDDYIEVCETMIRHIESNFKGQFDYCKKLCE